MARITHPRPQAGKQTFVGVTFYDGFAEVADLHPEVRAALVLHNFTIEDTERPVQPKKRSGKRKPAKPKKVAEQVTTHADGSFTAPDGYTGALPDADPSQTGPFAIVEMSDGTTIGDGKSLATLPANDEE
jgi:hypothetical protein